MSMQDYHNFKRIPLVTMAEWDMLTKFRRFIFSDKGRAKRAKLLLDRAVRYLRSSRPFFTTPSRRSLKSSRRRRYAS